MRTFIHANGLLPDKNNPYDFLFGDLGRDSSTMPVIVNELPVFNQYKKDETKAGCTFVNAFRDWCHNCGVKPKESDYVDIIKYAVATVDYIIGEGWLTEDAMNVVRKWTKIEYPHITAHYVKLYYTDHDLEVLLDKGYSVGVTYRGNKKYNEDYQKDNILDGYSFGLPTYGHRTCLKKDGKYYINDSTGTAKYTKYELKEFKKLFDNYIYYPWVYVWILDRDDNVEEIKRLVGFRADCIESNKYLELCSNRTNDVAYKSECIKMIKTNNNKIATINTMLKEKNYCNKEEEQ